MIPVTSGRDGRPEFAMPVINDKCWETKTQARKSTWRSKQFSACEEHLIKKSHGSEDKCSLTHLALEPYRVLPVHVVSFVWII